MKIVIMAVGNGVAVNSPIVGTALRPNDRTPIWSIESNINLFLNYSLKLRLTKQLIN